MLRVFFNCILREWRVHWNGRIVYWFMARGCVLLGSHHGGGLWSLVFVSVAVMFFITIAVIIIISHRSMRLFSIVILSGFLSWDRVLVHHLLNTFNTVKCHFMVWWWDIYSITRLWGNRGGGWSGWGCWDNLRSMQVAIWFLLLFSLRRMRLDRWHYLRFLILRLHLDHSHVFVLVRFSGMC